MREEPGAGVARRIKKDILAIYWMKMVEIGKAVLRRNNMMTMYKGVK